MEESMITRELVEQNVLYQAFALKKALEQKNILRMASSIEDQLKIITKRIVSRYMWYDSKQTTVSDLILETSETIEKYLAPVESYQFGYNTNMLNESPFLKEVPKPVKILKLYPYSQKQFKDWGSRILIDCSYPKSNVSFIHFEPLSETFNCYQACYDKHCTDDTLDMDPVEFNGLLAKHFFKLGPVAHGLTQLFDRGFYNYICSDLDVAIEKITAAFMNARTAYIPKSYYNISYRPSKAHISNLENDFRLNIINTVNNVFIPLNGNNSSAERILEILINK